MKFKSIMNETVGIEYSNTTNKAITHDNSASNTEKYIASEIVKAFSTSHKYSDDLKQRYGQDLKPDDVVVSDMGSYYQVEFTPEDEVHKKMSSSLSKQHLEKGIGNPQTMALILLGR